MMRWMIFAVLLFALRASALAQADEDALSLLERVTKHYRDAESIHLEAIVNTVTHNEYQDGSSRSILSAYIASGGRFRYQGQDSSGSGSIVSDGTTEWRFLPSFREFAKEPAGTYFGRRIAVQGDDRPMVEASSLVQGIISLDTQARTAHYLPPETIEVAGRKVKCSVVQFGTEDGTQRPAQGGSTSETNVWIDPTSMSVVRQKVIGHNRFVYGSRTPPFGQITELVKTTTYAVTEIDYEPDPRTFVFQAPADSKEVAQLPSAIDAGSNSAEHDRQTANKKHDDAFLGKPLPPITLRDAQGADVQLSRYKGHPLLIDIWATWCGPCLLELPTFQKIRASTNHTDLAIIAVDEDNESADAVQLLKRRGYDWLDVHYDRDLVKQLSVQAIPVIILVDAEGKIVYYHSGADDPEGLKASIAALGDAYRKVSVK